MKTAVIGSRSFTDYSLLQEHRVALAVSEIISGGAKGADTLGAYFAREQGIPLTEFLPDYARYGQHAPLVRNRSIIEAADQVVAFWDGRSTGTAHAMRLARELGKPLTVVRF